MCSCTEIESSDGILLLCFSFCPCRLGHAMILQCPSIRCASARGTLCSWSMQCSRLLPWNCFYYRSVATHPFLSPMWVNNKQARGLLGRASLNEHWFSFAIKNDGESPAASRLRNWRRVPQVEGWWVHSGVVLQWLQAVSLWSLETCRMGSPRAKRMAWGSLLRLVWLRPPRLQLGWKSLDHLLLWRSGGLQLGVQMTWLEGWTSARSPLLPQKKRSIRSWQEEVHQFCTHSMFENVKFTFYLNKQKFSMELNPSYFAIFGAIFTYTNFQSLPPNQALDSA